MLTKKCCVVCGKVTNYFTDRGIPICEDKKCTQKVQVAWRVAVNTKTDFAEVLRRM